MSKRENRRARKWVAAVGVALAATGAAGTVYGVRRKEKNAELFYISQTLFVSGVVLIGLAVLSKYRVTVDEAYKLGFDLGDEEGFRRGREVGKPVVVDMAAPPDNKRNFR